MKQWAVLLLAVFAVSCQQAGVNKAFDSDVMKKDNVLEKVFHFENVSEPEYIDPGLIADSSSSNIVTNLFEGLTGYDMKSLSSKPGVATHWKVSADKKTYTFYLRKNAKWSDGKSVTAHDFVYSWQRAVSPQLASRYAFMMYFIKNAKAISLGKIKDITQLGVKAVDDYTLQVELNQPVPFFVSLTAWYTYYPVRKDIVEKYKARWTRPEHIVSNGFFSLSEWVPNKQISVVKNDHYWDKKNVHLDKVIFYAITDRETALKSYLKGKLHFVESPPNVKLKVLSNRDDFYASPMIGTYFLVFSVEKPPMNNQKFRQALSYAIDRKQLVKITGNGIAAANLVPKGIGDYEPAQGNEFNPDKARALLKESGLDVASKMPEITLIYNTSENHKMVLQIIQNMWKKHLGLNVTLHNMEWKVLLKLLQLHEYQISRFSWIGDYVDPNTFLEIFLSDSSSNFAQWKNKAYDQLLHNAMHTMNSKKRNELFHEAEDLLLHESPIIPIYTYVKTSLLSKKVTGFYHNLIGYHALKGVDITQ